MATTAWILSDIFYILMSRFNHTWLGDDAGAAAMIDGKIIAAVKKPIVLR